MTHPEIPPGVIAALDQRTASIAEALDNLVATARDLCDDDAMAISQIALALYAVHAQPGGPSTIIDTLAVAVRRLAKQ